MTNLQGIPQGVAGPRTRVDMGPPEPASLTGAHATSDNELSRTSAAVEAAIAEAAEAADPGASRRHANANDNVNAPAEAEEPPTS
jgi:hypothetical protein